MTRARIVSVNTGRPRDVTWRGRIYRTAYVKTPRTGPVRVDADGMSGDEQADLTVHGGPAKAVYAYPTEHLSWWSGELGRALGPGALGENLTLRGLLETDVRPGDRLEGERATLVVTEPRFPCVKMSVCLARADMVRRFKASGRCGFYLRVDVAGSLTAGEELRFLRSGRGPSIAELFRARYARGGTGGA